MCVMYVCAIIQTVKRRTGAAEATVVTTRAEGITGYAPHTPSHYFCPILSQKGFHSYMSPSFQPTPTYLRTPTPMHPLDAPFIAQLPPQKDASPGRPKDATDKTMLANFSKV
eukprot:GHVU01004552.1.p2 GENE.GHVU01004552.1~~GHVU01004552.1.p2  ORF type:complete len:112 (-),score=4.13 GHVU01004552.1:600-935(-)